VVLDPHIKNNFANSKVIIIFFIEIIFVNLKKQSTTTKMVSIPFHFKNYVMKSMETPSHGLFKTKKGL
jgi:hypothetical protein